MASTGHGGTVGADVAPPVGPVGPGGAAPATEDAAKVELGKISANEEKIKRQETAKRAEEAMRQLLEGCGRTSYITSSCSPRLD